MNEERKKRIEFLKNLEKASKPLIKFLNDNYQPHVSAIVTTNSVEVLEGSAVIRNINEFIKD